MSVWFYWSTIGGWAAFVLCVALAFWLVNSKGSVTETMTNGLIATFLIAFLNSFIAFGGCMLVGAASSAIPR